MIIKAKHNFFLFPFFRWYVLRKMKKSFHSCVFNTEISNTDKPVLLLCNHTSWWDGIWALHLNEKLFGKKYHFMMLEEQLKKNWFFQHTGGYSIKKSTRSVVESLNYTAELLENNKNLVLMFPQGKIQSMHRSEFVFEKGIERILKLLNNEIEIVFEVNLVDYLSNAKPTAYLNAKTYKGDYSLAGIEKAYNKYYNACLQIQEKLEE